MFTRKAHFIDAFGPLVIRAGTPDENLTVLYAAALEDCDQQVAKAVVRAVISIDAACRTIGTTWQGPKAEVRTAICHALRAMSHTEVYQRKGSAQVFSDKVHTVKTTLSHLKYAYDLAIALELYEVQPLIAKSDYSYFRVEGRTSELRKHILDNPQLPDIVRKYGKLASINQAETAIYETLLCSGARIAEVCSMNLAGARDYASTQQISVRNKCAGPRNTKTILLNPQTIAAIEAYIAGDLKNYNPNLNLQSQYNERQWSLDRYIQLLEYNDIDTDLTPLFYTRRRTPLTPNAFRCSWSRMHSAVPAHLKNKVPLVGSLHDFRRWYINAELDRINSIHQNDFVRHVAELRAFVTRMGWKSYLSLAPYDYRKIAMQTLERDQIEQDRLLLRVAQINVRTRRALLESTEAAGLGFRSGGLQ